MTRSGRRLRRRTGRKERLLAAPVKKSAGPREKAAGESGVAENAACAAASVQDTDDYNLGLLWDMDPDIRSPEIPDPVRIKGYGGVRVPCADAGGI